MDIITIRKINLAMRRMCTRLNLPRYEFLPYVAVDIDIGLEEGETSSSYYFNDDMKLSKAEKDQILKIMIARGYEKMYLFVVNDFMGEVQTDVIIMRVKKEEVEYEQIILWEDL